MVENPATPPEDDDSPLPPGPRRSTYTPPPVGARYEPDAPASTAAGGADGNAPDSPDADPIADAIAQEYRRWVPLGEQQSTSTGAPVPESRRDAMSAAPAAPTDADFGAPPLAPPTAAPSSGWAPTFETPAPEPVASPPTPGPGYPIYSPDAPSLAGLASESGPVSIPDSVPPPPTRVSLTDDALVAAVDPDRATTDTGTLLDLFEQQLALREQEAAQLNEWEQHVRASAGDHADEIVAQVRSAYTGVIDVIPPVGSPILAPPPGEVSSAEPTDSTPTAPGAVVPPFVAPAAAEPERLSGPELNMALADAPPPFGIQPTVATPPGSLDSVELEHLPPPLVDPAPVVAAGASDPLSGATELEALLAAAHAATGDTSTIDDEPDEPPHEDSPRGTPVSPVSDASPATPEPPVSVFAPPAAAAAAAAPATAPPAAAPASIDPSVPASTPIVLPVATVANPRPFVPEQSALEPTPAAQRAGRSVRLFWLWFSVNSSVVSVALGAIVLSLGMSLRQAILATLIGVAISFLPLGLGTLAGKWSGQPTMVISRATFGTAGNVLPAILAVLTRVIWAATLLWMLATGVSEVLAGAALTGGLPTLTVALIVGGVGLLLVSSIAGLGFGLIVIVGAVVAALGAVLVAGVIALTVSAVDLEVALSIGDGPWILLVSGAVLVLSVVGLAWAQSSGDLARYQAKGTLGSSAVLWTSFGATVPAFVLVSWGAVLAASDPALASSLATNPVAALAGLLPGWYPIPLILAISLGLIAAAALAVYSGGFAVLSVGAAAPRWIGVLISMVLTGALVAAFAVLVPDLQALLRDVLTTLAVPVAAWAGIFGAETMIRTRRVHSPSLLRTGGIYPAVRWVNLVMLLVATGLGWGFTSASVVGLTWQGYLWPLLAAVEPLSTSDAGVLLALVLGILTPIVAGIPALRSLQAAEQRAATADA